MDFQKIVDGMHAMTCVISVERLPDDRYGKLRIVTGNKAYISSIENPAPGTEMLRYKFVPNSEYTDYLSRDLNFEDFCYQAAIKKKLLHSYVQPERMDVWINMSFIPLAAEDEGDLCYCLYIMEINLEASAERLSNISGDIASSVLEICIRLSGTNDFEATMKDVVDDIRDLCDAELCCILVMDEIERSCYVLADSIKNGSVLLPMNAFIDDDFYDIAESWKDTIAGSNCLIVKNEQDMEVVKERNPVWYESLRSANVENIVLFPLKSRNQLLGYMWAVNFDPERAIKIKETMELTTFIVGSELGNHLLLDRLSILSSKDLLTGVMNRNEMNNYVDRLSQGEINTSVGVIFADLNGLKTVNDIEGHAAGDLLLKNAASALRAVFKEKEIFRAGGDEFAIIVKGLNEEQLNEKLECIRTETQKYDRLFFALGCAVEENGSNVRVALRLADERMYEDKKSFYKMNPEKENDERRDRANMRRSDGQIRERSIIMEMNYDHLTGLPSMTYFFELAESGRRRMHDDGIPSALVYVNLGGLRSYNKKYGFAEGDVLLKEFAAILKGQFSEEACSRFGKDDFAVYTEEKDLEKKLKRVFRKMRTANSGKTLLVRVGIYPDSMGLVETAIACDRAKYACDHSRDNFHSYINYYDQGMLQEEINRQYVVENIDRAINENWITAFYQPIIRTTSRRVCDEEALARWIDPVKGMLSPADFIPILEDTKLIYKVDLHIVDVVLERINKMKQMGFDVVPISVNLSRTDFEMCDIVSEICNRVDAAGVERRLITIEITESVIGRNFDYMKVQISRFQELGFEVWMDDFGSGYSSLDLLQELQFDLIKFDMRFMRQFENSPKSRVILSELMRMAINLNIETVTEGVETAEQVDFLSEIGCNKMQGYYFHKPSPTEEVFEIIKRGEEIKFENPSETQYHKLISSVNLYDLGSISNDEAGSAVHYTNTMPMAVIETDGKEFSVKRSNRSFREYRENYPELIEPVRNGVLECKEIAQRVFLDEASKKGENFHILIRKIAENHMDGVEAFAVAVLDITAPDADLQMRQKETIDRLKEETVTYSRIAALIGDFLAIYTVDPDTCNYMQYNASKDYSTLGLPRAGVDFFEDTRKEVKKWLVPEDEERFMSVFTKENILKRTGKGEVFSVDYSLVIGGVATGLTCRAGLVNEKEGAQLVVGVIKTPVE
ncbi:MAG: EAL domain-containing protein [Lachnospiraceae bacterium]|nr:EAL domain-containing protein [Lachnospiraceae bacterium]